MSDIFNHKYYYYLYTMNLKSIISLCGCKYFDPINNNAEYKLNDIHAYLEVYGFSKEIPKCDIKEIRDLFEKAVKAFGKRYLEETHKFPANYDTYITLIISMNSIGASLRTAK